MDLLVLFIVQKKTWEQFQSYTDVPLLGQNDQITPNKIFFRKTINIIPLI